MRKLATIIRHMMSKRKTYGECRQLSEPMSTIIACPHCQQSIPIPADFSGGGIRCPKCNGVCSLPRQPQPASAAAPVVQFSAGTPNRPAAVRPTHVKKRNSGVPLIAWILGGVFGAMLLCMLLCVGLVGYAIRKANQVDPRFEGKTVS
jgi:hypothetical protein